MKTATRPMKQEVRSVPVGSPGRRWLRRIYQCRALYLLLLPALLYLILFRVSAIFGMKLAFYDYNIMTDNVWAGLKYFRQIFSSPMFSDIVKNTILISSLKIFLLFPLPVIFAILLNELKIGRFRKTVQVISYLPHFLSWVVIAGIWIEFLSFSGLIEDIYNWLGFTYDNWLLSQNSIIGVLLGSEAWRSMGWDSIIYLTAILGIQAELYEAATIDGASRWQIIKHIVIPALIPAMVTVLVLNCGYILSAGYDQVLVFQNSAVQSRIDIIDTYVYRIGLKNGSYSLATAAGLFKSAIGVVFLLITHFASKKLTGKGAW